MFVQVEDFEWFPVDKCVTNWTHPSNWLNVTMETAVIFLSYLTNIVDASYRDTFQTINILKRI